MFLACNNSRIALAGTIVCALAFAVPPTLAHAQGAGDFSFGNDTQPEQGERSPMTAGEAEALRGLSGPPPQPQGLRVPSTPSSNETEPAAEPSAPVQAFDSEYRVRPGDTLSGIARRVYGAGSLWPLILEANNDVLDGSPSRLGVGMDLTIPALGPEAQARAQRLGRAVSNAGDGSTSGARWLYSEGIARAVVRQFLTFATEGSITYLDPNIKEGDFIERGQVIAYQDQRRPQAEIQTAEASIIQSKGALAVAEATFNEAQANLKLAERTFSRFEILLGQNSASQQEYDEAQASLESARATATSAMLQIGAAKAQIGVTTSALSSAELTRDESYLTAPISGLIARINIREGTYYRPSFISTATEQSVFDTVPVIMIDPTQFEISVSVASNLINELEVGSPVAIEIVDPGAPLEERAPDGEIGLPQPFSDFAIQGTIYAISPVFDSDLRNFLIKVRTNRGEMELRDGATVSMWLRRSR